MWSVVLNIRVMENLYVSDKDVDIYISFVNGYYEDVYFFDGQGGILVYVFYLYNNLGQYINKWIKKLFVCILIDKCYKLKLK